MLPREVQQIVVGRVNRTSEIEHCVSKRVRVDDFHHTRRLRFFLDLNGDLLPRLRRRGFEGTRAKLRQI